MTAKGIETATKRKVRHDRANAKLIKAAKRRDRDAQYAFQRK